MSRNTGMKGDTGGGMRTKGKPSHIQAPPHMEKDEVWVVGIYIRFRARRYKWVFTNFCDCLWRNLLSNRERTSSPKRCRTATRNTVPNMQRIQDRERSRKYNAQLQVHDHKGAVHSGTLRCGKRLC
jgi:hypothetical protein